MAEVKDGKITAVTREVQAAAMQLAAKAGGEPSAVVLGRGSAELGKDLLASGAHKVYAVDDAALDSYNPDAFARALEQVIAKTGPKIVLFGQTDIGRDLAPRLAFKLNASLTMDAVEVSFEGNRFLATKPVYGGNANATYEAATELHLATIRVKVYEALPRNDSAIGSVENIAITIDPASVKVKVLEVTKQESSGMRLEDAPVVVAGGRGLGGPEPFKLLEELAKILGGAMGASRAVCDVGWVPVDKQIGLTGKTVTPDLYIAVAISGASQHMAGCSGAKTIVAINKDKDAPIFRESRYGVAGEWEQVLPAFIEMCKELRGA